MQIKFSDSDIQFLRSATAYVALSLDGDAPDNSKLGVVDKLAVLGKCFYTLQMLDNMDKEN